MVHCQLTGLGCAKLMTIMRNGTAESISFVAQLRVLGTSY
jgi:hypothetical protein